MLDFGMAFFREASLDRFAPPAIHILLKGRAGRNAPTRAKLHTAMHPIQKKRQLNLCMALITLKYSFKFRETTADEPSRIKFVGKRRIADLTRFSQALHRNRP